MWLLLAFLSATLLGFYDSFKKKALHDNAVIPILFLNTVFSVSVNSFSTFGINILAFYLFVFVYSDFRRQYIPCITRRLGSASLHSSKEFNCLVQLDFRLFCHETSAFDNCWAD